MLERMKRQARLARVITSLARTTCHNCDNCTRYGIFKVPNIDNEMCVACIGANLKENGK